MIPYFEAVSFSVGPLTLQVWGLLVALGMLAAVLLSLKLSARRALSKQVILDVALWGIIGGMIGGRLFYVIFYEPAYFISNPGAAFRFWEGGASSLGGFIGAALGIFLLAKIKRLKFGELAPYFDILNVGFWLGWGIGRLGCFFIHDHPGRLTDFFLAVNFPSGARHDLGLYESVLALTIFILSFVVYKKTAAAGRPGRVFVWSFILYAAARFFLDFLRANDLPQADVRFFFLTPAQWGMLVLFLILTFSLFWRKIRRKNGEVA